MIRSASRTLVRQSLPTFRAVRTQRFLSTAPPAQRSRSWKNSAVRWGLAIGGLYYYNTSNVFADEPAYSIPVPSAQADDSAALPTLESISASRQSKPSHSNPPVDSSPSAQTVTAAVDPDQLEETEEEASQQGAFNEETGEINWDCPCLGGMAHGPCGEQFRAAFSCFVFSKDEPKGMDCIEHFKTMQGCFREHPDVYGDELASDGDEDGEVGANEGEVPSAEASSPTADATSAISPTKPSSRASKAEAENPHDDAGRTERARAATEQVARDHGPQSESDAMVPKAAHDATEAPTEK